MMYFNRISNEAVVENLKIWDNISEMSPLNYHEEERMNSMSNVQQDLAYHNANIDNNSLKSRGREWMDSAVVVVGHKLFKHSHADRVSDNIAAIAILTLALSTLPSLQQSNYKFRRLVRPFVRSSWFFTSLN